MIIGSTIGLVAMLVGRLMAPATPAPGGSAFVPPYLVALTPPHSPDTVLDVVLVPAAPSQLGADGRLDVKTFRRRAEVLVVGIRRNNLFKANAHLMNFWMSTEPVEMPTGRGPDCSWVDPTTLGDALLFADAVLVVHGTDRGGDACRDSSRGKVASVEFYNPGAAVHELGHALFNMPDEYAGGALDPIVGPILFANATLCSQEAGQPTSTGSGRRASPVQCEELQTHPLIVRPEVNLADVMSRGADGDNDHVHHGPKDQEYIERVIGEKLGLDMPVVEPGEWPKKE